MKLDELAPLFLTIELEQHKDDIYVRMSSNRVSVSIGRIKTSLGINNLNEDFREIVQVASRSKTMRKSCFRSLANIGFDLFTRIFSHTKLIEEQIHTHIEMDVIGVKRNDPETFQIGAFQTARILVVTNGINIPWELLYSKNPADFDLDGAPGEIDPQFFLGSNFVFQKHLVQIPSRASWEKRIGSNQGVSVFGDDRLRYAIEREIPAIENLFVSDGRRFEFPEAIPSGGGVRPKENLDYLLADKINAISEPILHFACHAVVEHGRARIRVRDNYFQEERPLRRQLQEAGSRSFVFLNACELALTRCRDNCGLVTAFLEKGYLGVIATEIPVRDEQASRFAVLVYEYFLNRQNRSLLSAVFFARQTLLEEDESLVGYTYATYGSWDLIRS